MTDTVIKVENLSKQYRLGQIGSGTIRDDFSRFWARMRGKEDPTLKIGQANTLSSNSQLTTLNSQLSTPNSKLQTLNSNYVWALKDINFEVKQGEVLGIIGKNGAGKSTLLKILSKVTSPTTGSVKVKGRIASLLEVGTGFHPELSGRENIFLNGAILGMTKTEIRSKFDEIVDFSGVEKYIDTPVKRYSSGMYVRLAFAVAAHLEPEILVVDEVLAVGDAEFQKKALGKMQDISKGQGRTVLFVSHNMTAIQSLCKNSMVIKNGSLDIYTNTNDAVKFYLQNNISNCYIKEWDKTERPTNDEIEICSIKIANQEGKLLDNLTIDMDFYIEIFFEVLKPNTKVGLNVILSDKNETVISNSINNTDDNYYGKYMESGFYISTCKIPGKLLNNGEYIISVFYFGRDFQNGRLINNVLKIELQDGIIVRKDYHGGYPGILRPLFKWVTDKIEEDH